MTGYVPPAAHVLAGIEAVAMAATWRCQHCAGKARVESNGIASEFVIPYIVEHEHEDGCPEHDDDFEAVEGDDDWMANGGEADV